MARNIEINFKSEENQYEVLYPVTLSGNITDLESYLSSRYYSKSEIDDGFINKGSATKVVQAEMFFQGVGSGFTANIDNEVKGVLVSSYYPGNGASIPQAAYLGFFSRNVNYGVIARACFSNSATTDFQNIFVGLTWSDTSLRVQVSYTDAVTYQMGFINCILLY